MLIKNVSVAFLLMVLASCTGTRITHSWKSEKAPVANYSKIMVLGLIREADIRIREKMEDHMVGDLKDLGYNAASSLREYGPKAFDKMEEAAAIEKIKSSGVNAVITIVMLDKTRERYYVPGHISYSPYGIYYDRFWGYYNTMYGRIYSPGYYEVSTRYFWESNLYDITSNELIYSVQTESFDPANTEMLGHEYGRMIIKDMVKKKVLTKKGMLAKVGG
jgi:hypothetical protein